MLKRFKEWGWVVAKSPRDHICPTCAGTDQTENRLADHFKVVTGEGRVPSRGELADQVAKERRILDEQTAILLERHNLGTSQTVKKSKIPDGPILVNGSVEVKHPAHIHEALSTIASETANNRAAVELMIDQFTKCQQLLNQQITALGNMTAMLARVGDGIHNGLRELSQNLNENTRQVEATNQHLLENTEVIRQVHAKLSIRDGSVPATVEPVSEPIVAEPVSSETAPESTLPADLLSMLMPEQAQQPEPEPEPVATIPADLPAEPPSSLPIPLSAQIRAARQAKRMTQQQIADKLGVSGSAVTQWESGTHAPRAETLPALCKLLGIKLSAAPRPSTAQKKSVVELKKRAAPASRSRAKKLAA
ncbi:helix-turn-helix domain-containing protein [Microvirga massiliensis]|uniref:helix-turn-helix domain-containing protein n=1 Tax=Microvirga massiliensis TaxID=1033741 RepID=UPI00062B7627|nr:helix-turn-helix transcriptional regulator [Microvirga massiliensis]